MAEPLDLSAILDMVESGDESLLAEDERALLPAKPTKRTDFGANLAETLAASDIAKLAQTAYDGLLSDEASRADWRKREKLGLRLLGISENDPFVPPWDGASRAVHPGLIEAIIQFQARAIAELWPPEGPAKAVAEGDGVNSALEQQAGRVARYLNWAYTQRMPGGYLHHDRMLFRLPLSGSAFKKIYYCPLSQTVVSGYVPAEDLIVPYGAADLETAPRVTHLLNYTGSDVRRLIESGAFRDVPLAGLSDGAEKTDLQTELDAVAGAKLDTADIEEHERYVFLEQSIRASLPGDPPNSPYLVTMERESQTVFAIYRDWREDDAQRKRRERFAHYYFFPGLDGFYGLGFLHVLGRLAESLSGNLRSLLDAGALANLRGGFRSADVKLPKGNRTDGVSAKPGEWIPVEATTEELQKLFVSIPYDEPSQTLFNLLQYLDDLIRRVAGTTGELLGESTKNVPVGTTLARIEQGLKVQTAIQIRCHQAQAKELALTCQPSLTTCPTPAIAATCWGSSRKRSPPISTGGSTCARCPTRTPSRRLSEWSSRKLSWSAPRKRRTCTTGWRWSASCWKRCGCRTWTRCFPTAASRPRAWGRSRKTWRWSCLARSNRSPTRIMPRTSSCTGNGWRRWPIPTCGRASSRPPSRTWPSMSRGTISCECSGRWACNCRPRRWVWASRLTRRPKTRSPSWPRTRCS